MAGSISIQTLYNNDLRRQPIPIVRVKPSNDRILVWKFSNALNVYDSGELELELFYYPQAIPTLPNVVDSAFLSSNCKRIERVIQLPEAAAFVLEDGDSWKVDGVYIADSDLCVGDFIEGSELHKQAAELKKLLQAPEGNSIASVGVNPTKPTQTSRQTARGTAGDPPAALFPSSGGGASPGAQQHISFGGGSGVSNASAAPPQQPAAQAKQPPREQHHYGGGGGSGGDGGAAGGQHLMLDTSVPPPALPKQARAASGTPQTGGGQPPTGIQQQQSVGGGGGTPQHQGGGMQMGGCAAFGGSASGDGAGFTPWSDNLTQHLTQTLFGGKSLTSLYEPGGITGGMRSGNMGWNSWAPGNPMATATPGAGRGGYEHQQMPAGGYGQNVVGGPSPSPIGTAWSLMQAQYGALASQGTAGWQVGAPGNPMGGPGGPGGPLGANVSPGGPGGPQGANDSQASSAAAAINISKDPMVGTVVCGHCKDLLHKQPAYTLSCKHKMHVKCAKEWFGGGQQTCPACRVYVLPPKDYPKLN